MRVIMMQLKPKQNEYRVITYSENRTSSQVRSFIDAQDLLNFIKSFNLNYKLGTCNNGELSMIVIN